MTEKKDYYTVAEAAEALDVSPTTVWRWVKEGRLAAYRVGPRKIRIHKPDLETVVQPLDEAIPVKAPRLANPDNIWEGYDPYRALAGMRASFGAFRDIDIQKLRDDLRAERGQNSMGRPQ